MSRSFTTYIREIEWNNYPKKVTVKDNPFKKDTWEYHAFVFMFHQPKPKK